MRRDWLLLALFIVGAIMAFYKLRPRGVRINNPLNVAPVEGGWDGQIGVSVSPVDPDPLAVFDTVYKGARAGAINVLGDYYRRGLTSLSALAGDYVGASHAGDYAANLASFTGLDPQAPLPADRLRDVLYAISRIEQGGLYYSRMDLDAGFNAGAAHLGVTLA